LEFEFWIKKAIFLFSAAFFETTKPVGIGFANQIGFCKPCTLDAMRGWRDGSTKSGKRNGEWWLTAVVTFPFGTKLPFLNSEEKEMYSHPNNRMKEAGHSKCSVRFMFLTFKGKYFVLALHLFVPNKDEI
jgi:hypothetical protein